jgi:double-stranded uracil-DNA glycosylase
MLKDILVKNLDIVFCGTAKGKTSAKLGYYYAGPNNKFYGALYNAGFTPYKLSPCECYDINKFNIGLTDLVHVQFGNDKDISKENYEIDVFIKKMKIVKPKFIAFTSKTAASFAYGFKGVTRLIDYGLQTQLIGSSSVFVLPSTSGAAGTYWNEKYWVELYELIRQ